MRGFVITLVTVSIIVVLAMLAASLRSSYLSMERAFLEPQPLMYAAALFDDVAGDINAIAGPEISVSQGNESTGITVSGQVPDINRSGALEGYRAFLEEDVAAKTHADIGLNLTNLSGGRVRAVINGRYLYENDMAGQEMVFTSASPGGTGAYGYAVNISVDRSRANFTEFEHNESGDMNVTLRYIDDNGTVYSSYVLPSGIRNRMKVDYSGGGYLIIDIGSVESEDGSLSISAGNATAHFTVSALLPPMNESDSVGYAYDAWMEYSMGGVHMARAVGR